jgi:uncharacterized protein YifN (PemK superfamily)
MKLTFEQYNKLIDEINKSRDPKKIQMIHEVCEYIDKTIKDPSFTYTKYYSELSEKSLTPYTFYYLEPEILKELFDIYKKITTGESNKQKIDYLKQCIIDRYHNELKKENMKEYLYKIQNNNYKDNIYFVISISKNTDKNLIKTLDSLNIKNLGIYKNDFYKQLAIWCVVRPQNALENNISLRNKKRNPDANLDLKLSKTLQNKEITDNFLKKTFNI